MNALHLKPADAQSRFSHHVLERELTNAMDTLQADADDFDFQDSYFTGMLL